MMKQEKLLAIAFGLGVALSITGLYLVFGVSERSVPVRAPETTIPADTAAPQVEDRECAPVLTPTELKARMRAFEVEQSVRLSKIEKEVKIVEELIDEQQGGKKGVE